MLAPNSFSPTSKDDPVEAESLSPYLFFSPTTYTRNLVFKNELFEVLALCWEVGQVSRIHDHHDQQYWMAVTTGRLKNQNYRVLDRDPEKLTCRIEPTRTFLITPTSPLEVDSMGLTEAADTFTKHWWSAGDGKSRSTYSKTSLGP